MNQDETTLPPGSLGSLGSWYHNTAMDVAYFASKHNDESESRSMFETAGCLELRAIEVAARGYPEGLPSFLTAILSRSAAHCYQSAGNTEKVDEVCAEYMIEKDEIIRAEKVLE